MPTATACRDAVPVSFHWTDPETGLKWLHVKLEAPFDYDQVKALPQVLMFEGERYARTGWNSDKGEAYYRNQMLLALKED